MADAPPTVNEPLFLIKGIGMITCFFLGAFSVFFCIWKSNYDASSCALALEIVCVSLLNLNANYKKGKLREKVKPGLLILLLVIGLLAAVAMFAFMIYYTVKAIELKNYGIHIPLMQNGDKAFPAILAGLASFWGAVLAYDCFRFKRMLEGTLPM